MSETRYDINQHQYEDEPSWILKDNINKAVVELLPGVGGQVVRFELDGHPLVLTPTNLDTLRNKSARYGVPILFPPNRIHRAQYTYKGRTYQFPPKAGTPHYSHGELSRKPWIVAEAGAEEEKGAYLITRFRYQDHPDMFEHFPHNLVFEITYRLHEGKLICSGSILNEGKDEAPLALGFHPYFPVAPKLSTRVVIPAVAEWPISDDGFVNGLPQVTMACEQLRSGCSFEDVPSEGYMLLEMPRGQSNRCELQDHERGMKIVMECSEQFPFMVLFKPTWADAISLEPYTYITDGFNSSLATEITGVRGIQAGEVFTYEWSVWQSRDDI
jgi:aldose 1-epimerase